MADEPTIWERLPSDTDKSYEAFCIYRDMGTARSLAKACKKFYGNSKANLGQIEKWSRDHNWQVRVSACDTHRAAERAKRKEAKRIQIEDNVLKDYHALRKAIDKRLRILEAGDYRSEISDLHSLLALMKNADDYARRAVDLPDKITQQKNEHTGANGGAIKHDVAMRWEEIMNGTHTNEDDPLA